MASSVFLFPGSIVFTGNVTAPSGIFDSVILDRANQDVILVRDAAAVLALKNGIVAQTFKVYGNATKLISIAHDGTNASIHATSGILSLATDSSAVIQFNAAGANIWNFNVQGHLLANTDNSFDIGAAGANRPKDLYLAGVIKNLGSITTAGNFGVAPIVAVSSATALNAADTNRINYIPAATAGTYELTGVVDVTAWATPASFAVSITYKDGSGNARTDTAGLVRGSNGATAAAITAIDRWYFHFPAVDIDASATAITLSTSGTFTGTPAYNIAATLRRVR